MPLQKTNLGALTKKIRSKFTERLRRSMTPAKPYGNSIEITPRQGSHSANSPLTSNKKNHGGLSLKRESHL